MSFRHDLDDPETIVEILTELRGMYIGEEIAISGRKGCRASKEVLEETSVAISQDIAHLSTRRIEYKARLIKAPCTAVS